MDRLCTPSGADFSANVWSDQAYPSEKLRFTLYFVHSLGKISFIPVQVNLLSHRVGGNRKRYQQSTNAEQKSI